MVSTAAFHARVRGSASDRQGSNFESCVWRTVSSQSSHHPKEVLLAQFSLYVHKGGLKPDSFHLHFFYVVDLMPLALIGLAGVAYYRHQAELIRTDQPQTRKWLKFSDAVRVDWRLYSSGDHIGGKPKYKVMWVSEEHCLYESEHNWERGTQQLQRDMLHGAVNPKPLAFWVKRMKLGIQKSGLYWAILDIEHLSAPCDHRANFYFG